MGQNVFQLLLAGIAGVGDLLVDPDQLAQHGFLPYNLRVSPHVGGGGNGGDNVPQSLQAGHLRRHVLLLQTILKVDHVHRLAFIEQLHHALKHDAVLALVKIILCDDLGSRNDRVPVHEHGADHRLLRLYAVGLNPL